MNSWHVPGRYDFSIPEAQRLSDLSGIDSDLEAVLRICTRCEKLMKEMPPPVEGPGMVWWEEVQALGDLMFAAVVRYGRTLSTGAREGVPAAWINSLPEALRKSHAYFKALRDKYIAHSVNQLEDNQVFVMLTPQFAEQQEPTHITVDRGHLITIGLQDLGHLVSLVHALREVVATEVESETSRVLAIARAMPIEEIKARSTESVAIPGKAETFSVRKKFER
jgi:hypothetical protein